MFVVLVSSFIGFKKVIVVGISALQKYLFSHNAYLIVTWQLGVEKEINSSTIIFLKKVHVVSTTCLKMILKKCFFFCLSLGAHLKVKWWANFKGWGNINFNHKSSSFIAQCIYIYKSLWTKKLALGYKIMCITSILDIQNSLALWMQVFTKLLDTCSAISYYA